MTINIVHYCVNDEECQKNFNEKLNDGKTFHESTKKIMTATAGVLSTRDTVFLDKELLDYVRSWKKEIQGETNKIVQNAAQVYDIRAKFIATKPVPKYHEDIHKMKAVENLSIGSSGRSKRVIL